MKQRLLMSIGIAALAACACPKPTPVTTNANAGDGSATGSAAPPVTTTAPAEPTTCDGVKPKLDQLYRADALAVEPKRVDERTADNVGMVLVECGKHPAQVVACVNGAATIKDIESQCLAPIDDEGTEGLAGAGK